MNDDHIYRSPDESNVFVERLLDKLEVEFNPEIIPVVVDSSARKNNCFINVDEKVKRDGGKVHYGWVVFQTDILCEAERHAVWENPKGDLIDITPRDVHFDRIMFVSDNEFVYTGQLVDNVRLNTTKNPVVDDFIAISEIIEDLYGHGNRIDEKRITFPEHIGKVILTYETLKQCYLTFIREGGKPSMMCFCDSGKVYHSCHGKPILKVLRKDAIEIKKMLGERPR